MTPDTTDQTTPLALATAARVSCHLLEEEIADLVRKPTALRAKSTTERCARLWREIDALAARIEDQQQEIERLEQLAYPLSQVVVVDTTEAAREISKERLQPVFFFPADVPDVEFVPGSDPRPPTSALEPRPAPSLGIRPPGFQEVRRRMQRHGRRTEAIDRIKAARGEGDHVPRKGRTNSLEWKVPSKQTRPWERFVKAVEEGRLPVGESFPVSKLLEETGITQATLQLMQGDLVIEGAPYRIKKNGPRGVTIVRV